jgi:hypothetical protein
MAALARYVLTADVTIAWPATWSEIIAGSPNTPVAAPAVPATTVAAGNAAGVPVLVTVTGATVTAVTVNGTQAGTAAGAYVVPYPGSIALTYPSGTPTWTWAAADLPNSGTSSFTGPVSAVAPPAGQAGTIQQTTFLQGTPLWLDSAGQLYAAIGGGNLRAWIDGTDNVGHGHWACLGN